ncbi:MAG: hypothetical protein ACPG5U_02480 [Planktomarina sp.]
MSFFEGAYTRKQWIKAVNFAAIFGTIGVLTPNILTHPLQILMLFPYAIIVGFLISWVFISPVLLFAMQRPASYVRAGTYGGISAALVAILGFALAESNRWHVRNSSFTHNQIGGGDYIREIDGFVTPYGWQIIIQNNAAFVILGIAVGLLLRWIIGPGRNINNAP